MLFDRVVGKRGRSKPAALCLALLALLTSCAMPGWNTTIGLCFPGEDPEQPRCFGNFEQALAYQRATHSNAVAQIAALDLPLAQKAVIVLPPRHSFEEGARHRDYRSEKDFRLAVTISENDSLFIEKIIRKRRIFSETQLLRSTSVARLDHALDNAKDAFVIWLPPMDVAQIRAPGTTQFLRFGHKVQPGRGYLDAARKYLRVLEMQVRAQSLAT